MTDPCREAFEKWYDNRGWTPSEADWLTWQGAWNISRSDLQALQPKGVCSRCGGTGKADVHGLDVPCGACQPKGVEISKEELRTFLASQRDKNGIWPMDLGLKEDLDTIALRLHALLTERMGKGAV